MVGRLPGTPKTGGRRRGTLDREQRKLLTDRMAHDLMWCYQKLGGRQFLLKFATEQPAEFLRQGLSRLFPAPQKEDPDAAQYNQFNQYNLGNLNEREVATRIAFALSLGLQDQQEQVIEAREPYSAISPQEACHIEPPADADQQAFFRDVTQSQEEKLNSESLDERCARKAFADSPPRPAWMPRREDLL